MDIIGTQIPEVVVVKPQVFGDRRGYFVETFRYDAFAANIESINFIQDNESKSAYGVLRGLHYQLPPYAQSKLVRAVSGRILDVAVDIRPESPTFGRHAAVELSEENKHQLFIPRGFAHGFVVLSQEAVVAYKVDAYYAPEHERGIRFDDPDLGIDWILPQEDIRVSDKDRRWPWFGDRS
jgi:dTDP-4-dehydrorhamnose 3,5-epimerase